MTWEGAWLELVWRSWGEALGFLPVAVASAALHSSELCMGGKGPPCLSEALGAHTLLHCVIWFQLLCPRNCSFFPSFIGVGGNYWARKEGNLKCLHLTWVGSRAAGSLHTPMGMCEGP